MDTLCVVEERIKRRIGGILPEPAKRTIRSAQAVVGTQRTRWLVRALAASAHDPIRLEVGAGRGGRPGWLTLDKNGQCDLFWDLRRGIPFPDGSLEALYSSHFLEHLSYDEIRAFLSESLRALRDGGTISLCVPNARLYLEAYAGRRELTGDQWFGWRPAYNNTTRIDIVNYVAYMGGEHRYMWDEENLVYVLSDAGFQDVALRDFDPSLDLAERDFESIYAIAYK
jgi:predicted SAM-dependent methyltransferase